MLVKADAACQCTNAGIGGCILQLNKFFFLFLKFRFKRKWEKEWEKSSSKGESESAESTILTGVQIPAPLPIIKCGCSSMVERKCQNAVTNGHLSR
jgi:hypothetical protein